MKYVCHILLLFTCFGSIAFAQNDINEKANSNLIGLQQSKISLNEFIPNDETFGQKVISDTKEVHNTHSVYPGPTIDQAYFLGGWHQLTQISFSCYSDQVFSFSNEWLVHFSSFSSSSPPNEINLRKMVGDEMVATLDRKFTYPGPFVDFSYPPVLTNTFQLVKLQTGYAVFQGFVEPAKDSLYILDSNLEIQNIKALDSKLFENAFTNGTDLFILLKDTNQFTIQKTDQNGNLLNQTIISEEITNYSFNENHLALFGTTNLYIFNTTLNSYTSLPLIITNGKVVSNNLIYTHSGATKSLNLNTFITTPLKNYEAEIFDLKSNGDFCLTYQNSISRYNTLNLETNNFTIPEYNRIEFSENYFLTRSESLANNSQDDFTVYSSTGNLIFSQTLNRTTRSELKITETAEGIVLLTGNKLTKINPLGDLLWIYDRPVNKFMAMSNGSIWLIIDDYLSILTRILPDNNRCAYTVLNPFDDNYCPTYNNVAIQTFAKLNGDIPPTFSTRPVYGFVKGINNLVNPYSYKWFKNGSLVDSTLMGNFTGPANYKIQIKQHECEISSIEKFIGHSSSLNPPTPILSTETNPVCANETIEIYAKDEKGQSVYQPVWIDNYQNSDPSPYAPRIDTLTENSTFSAITYKNLNFYTTLDNHPNTYFFTIGPPTLSSYIPTCLSDTATITIEVNPIPAPPTLQTNSPIVCPSEEVKILGAGCLDILKWENGQNDTILITKPTATTTYSAQCIQNGCESIASNISITVSQFNNKLSLNGIANNNYTHHAKEIESSQYNTANFFNGYTAAESITLKPGFFAKPGSTFSAKISPDCSN